jgi:hypothetical protein
MVVSVDFVPVFWSNGEITAMAVRISCPLRVENEVLKLENLEVCFRSQAPDSYEAPGRWCARGLTFCRDQTPAPIPPLCKPNATKGTTDKSPRLIFTLPAKRERIDTKEP